MSSLLREERRIGSSNGIFAPVSPGVHPRSLHRPDAAWNLCPAACAGRYARWLCRASRAMADAARTTLPALSSPKYGLEYCACVQYSTSGDSSLCHWPSWRRTASYLLAFGCVICSLPCLMTTTCSWSGLCPLSRTDKHPESPTTQATGSLQRAVCRHHCERHPHAGARHEWSRHATGPHPGGPYRQRLPHRQG